jgi:class 3 adenylate cyclase/tetratricopeptide (TPR) repeat protein
MNRRERTMIICERCGSPSPAGFRYCGLCGAPLASEAEQGDARKVVTALFCDVVGSTALASELDPEAMHRVLRGYFEDIGTTIARHGGTIEKFAGDAIFAVFGIPTLHEDDALRAVRAAVEIRDRLPVLASEVGMRLEFHIALNTGLVHTDEERSVAIGDAVNVAARLQQAASSGEILLGATTMQLVRGAVKAEALEPLRLKGKAERIQAFRLLELQDDAVRPFGASALIGREAELRQLRTAWQQTLEERRCHQLTIVAPAGIGKSRLAQELLAELAQAATVLRGRCLHYGEGITFWPLRDALAPLGGVAADVLDRLTSGRSATREELFLAVRRLLESTARERPVILLIEDLHWAEPMLLELLGHIVELTDDAALLVLCTARNELLENADSNAEPLRSGSLLRLKPLPRSACEALLQGLGQALAPSTRAQIIAASDGNPLFLEEMAALARESGRVEVPPTIQALLAARLEQLPALEREPLERGAVEGNVFHAGAVAALLPERSKQALADALAALQRKQLIAEDPGTVAGQVAYRFRHQLIRDTAYERLPLARRGELHERFADWAEEAAGETANLDEIVGWHLEQAARYRRDLRLEDSPELRLRAARHLHRGGTRAGERGDVFAARNLLERALALTSEDDPLRIEVSLTLAERLIEAGDLARADELLSLVERRGEAHPQAVLNRLEWRFFSELGDALAMLESMVPEMVPRFQHAGDERALARTHWLLFLMRWGTCQATLAAHEARLAAEHARTSGDMGLWSRALGWYIATLIYGPGSADELALAITTIEREQPGPYLAACLALGRAEAERRNRRFTDAHKFMAQALAGWRELGMPVMAATSEHLHASISLSEGNPGAARAALLRSDAILAERDERPVRSTTLARLAQVDEQLDSLDEARVALERAEAVSAPGDVINFVITHCARARLALRDGDTDTAERWARGAVEQAARTDFVGDHAAALVELSRVLWVAGRGEEARSVASRALKLFKARGDLPGVDAARLLVAGRDPMLDGAPVSAQN